MGSQETSRAVYAIKQSRENEIRFTRAELFHQMLMEDFRFLEAARFATGGYDPPVLNYKDVAIPEEFREAAVAYPNGLIQFDHFTHRSPYRLFPAINIEPDTRSLKFPVRRTNWPPVSIFAHWFLNTQFFAILMVVIIIVNSMTIALDQELGESASTKLRRHLENLDFFFLCMFIAEILLRWLDDFGSFWDDGWKMFDFFVTAISLIPPLFDLISPDSSEEEELESIMNVMKYLRIIRIFRSLNVVTRIRKIQIIWAAVVKTFTAMFFITALMAIFFFIFAIIGIQTFDRYSTSHLGNLEYRHAFSNLPNSFVTLFQLFTLDHWFDLLKETSETMDSWTLPCIYILTWILLGSFIFRNLFVGVMVNNFQNIRMNMGTADQGGPETQMGKNQLNIFALDDLEKEHIDSNDPLVDWEAEIFHNLEIIRALKDKMSPILWPRDTMFQYYMILEAYASNLDERRYIYRLLDKAMVRFLDS